MLSKIQFIFFFVLLSIGALAQNCFEYHLTNCSPNESNFTYQINNSSVSYKFASGEVRTMPFTLMQGKDYRFTLCADSIFEGIIQLIFKTSNGKVLYDNSTQNFNMNLEIAIKKSQDIFIELKAPNASIGASDTIYLEGCIGLLIEEMVSIRTGF